MLKYILRFLIDYFLLFQHIGLNKDHLSWLQFSLIYFYLYYLQLYGDRPYERLKITMHHYCIYL